MGFKPILLETSLGAIFHRVTNTLRASVEWNKLLVKLLVLFHVSGGIIDAILLILPYMLERTLVILALAHMYHLVIRWMRGFDTYSHSCHIHHC